MNIRRDALVRCCGGEKLRTAPGYGAVSVQFDFPNNEARLLNEHPMGHSSRSCGNEES